MKIIAAIATAGRRETLSQTVQQIDKQTRLPDHMVICPAGIDDCDEEAVMQASYPVSIVRGVRGLPAQRNLILSSLKEADDVVVFFDDDFYPCSDFMAEIERTFNQHPDAVGLTGQVLVDGALTAGVSHGEALQIIERDEAAPPLKMQLFETFSMYGCNMAFRLAPVRQAQLKFDEALPLYGWLEDLDFTRQIAKHGKIYKSNTMRGVHLATKAGRTSGVKFGYSQVANPIHIYKKRLITWGDALRRILRNFTKNILMSTFPEPWLDRRGRLKGNIIALIDLCTGKLDPQNITKLK